MAKLTGNVLGGVKGKLGNVYFAEYRGNTVIRAMPNPKKDKPSPKQKKIRNEFKLGNSLASKFKALFHFIKLANPEASPRKDFFSRVNLAILQNESELSIDYAKLEFTRGLLDIPNEFTLQSETDKISASWKNVDSQELQDDIVICLFDPAYPTPIILSTKRQTEFIHLSVPSFWKGHLIHCYTFAKNDKGKFSDSRYFGVVY